MVIGYFIKVRKKGFGVVKKFVKFVVRIYIRKEIEYCFSG